MKYLPLTKTGANFCLTALITSGVALSPFANAQVDSTEDTSNIFFDIFAGVELREVGNANRTSEESEEVDELQTRTNLSVFGAYDGDIITRAQINYKLRRESFAEKTQDDDSSLDGESNLRFGSATENYDLTFSHTSRTLLVDPEEDDLTSNRDDRNIFSVLGNLRTTPGKTNVFTIGATSTKIQFDEFSVNDSTRDSITASYTRRIDPVTWAGLNLSLTDIDFDVGDSGDYKYKRASIFFRRTLKRLSYDLNIGKYETEAFSGGEDSGPFSSLNVNYAAGSMQFSLTAERDITDTSQGNNNNEIFSDTSEIDGRIGSQDQILRKYFSAGATFNSLCLKCTLRVEVGKEDESFFNLTQESSESEFVRASASYHPIRNLTLALNAKRSNFSYTERINANNYTYTVLRASAGISDILRNLKTSLFIESLEREFDLRGDYKSLSYGISLDYQFY